MNLGMLWFDNDPKVTLEIKVQRAAAYYRHKYGKTPTLCFVHPTMFPVHRESSGNDAAAVPAAVESAPQSDSYMAGGIEVRKNRSVLPNHFWLGVNGSSDAAAAT
jgi:hypothetical protein